MSLKKLFPIFLLLSLSCQTPIKTSKPQMTEYALPTSASMAAVDVTTPGARNDSVLLSDGTTWNFRISIPEIETGEKVPLVLALHWAGDNETYKEFMTCLVEPAFADLNAIVFGPDTGSHLWWDIQNVEKLLKFLALAKEKWPIDPHKIVVTGYSNGGTGTWQLAQIEGQAFSAAIPIAGSYYNSDRMDIPVYAIHGAKDELFPLSITQFVIAESVGKGSKIELVVVDDLAHYMACNYVDELRKAVAWLENMGW